MSNALRACKPFEDAGSGMKTSTVNQPCRTPWSLCANFSPRIQRPVRLGFKRAARRGRSCAATRNLAQEAPALAPETWLVSLSLSLSLSLGRSFVLFEKAASPAGSQQPPPERRGVQNGMQGRANVEAN